MEFAIQKNVPVPGRGEGHHLQKYPAKQMKPGDSFFVPGKTAYQFGGTAARFSQQVPGSEWILRTVTEKGVKGVRVWRVK